MNTVTGGDGTRSGDWSRRANHIKSRSQNMLWGLEEIVVFRTIMMLWSESIIPVLAHRGVCRGQRRRVTHPSLRVT